MTHLVYKVITLQLVHRNIGRSFMLNMNSVQSAYGKSHFKMREKIVCIFTKLKKNCIGMRRHWPQQWNRSYTTYTQAQKTHNRSVLMVIITKAPWIIRWVAVDFKLLKLTSINKLEKKKNRAVWAHAKRQSSKAHRVKKCTKQMPNEIARQTRICTLTNKNNYLFF